MPAVIFFACIDIEQKSSFLDKHYLRVLLEVISKKVFCPDFCVGTEFQLLEILLVCLQVETRSRLELEPKSYF